ncbi:MAG: PepSY domain-containing protein, partial [Myxococcales bacterium]|nr:PepSY domain-containing protein [Myxococcales bacterium]
MSARWRGWWPLHRRIGVALALFAVVIALSGLLLIFRDQLRPPTPKAPPVAATLSLDALVARAVASGDGSPATDITLPSAPGEPYQIWLDDDDETVIFLDGGGAVIGRRTSRGSLTRVLFELHTGELLGPAGTLITLVTGVGLLGLALSGVAMASARW